MPTPVAVEPRASVFISLPAKQEWHNTHAQACWSAGASLRGSPGQADVPRAVLGARGDPAHGSGGMESSGPRWRERGGRGRKLAGRRSYPATPASEEEGATSTTTPSPRRGGHGPRPHPSIPFRVVDGHGLSFSSPDSPGPEAGRRCRPLSRKCEGKLGSLNVKLLEPQPTPPQVPLELGAPCSSAGRRSASPPRGADVWKWPGDTFDCQSLSGPGAG